MMQGNHLVRLEESTARRFRDLYARFDALRTQVERAQAEADVTAAAERSGRRSAWPVSVVHNYRNVVNVTSRPSQSPASNSALTTAGSASDGLWSTLPSSEDGGGSPRAPRVGVVLLAGGAVMLGRNARIDPLLDYGAGTWVLQYVWGTDPYKGCTVLAREDLLDRAGRGADDDGPRGQVSPAMAFARERCFGTVLILVMAAARDTRLVRTTGGVGSVPEWRSGTGSAYRNAVRRVREACAANAHRGARLTCVLWAHGEEEGANVGEESYSSALAETAAALRRDCGVAEGECPFVVADLPGAFRGRPVARALRRTPGTRFATVDSPPDEVAYSATRVRALGVAMAEVAR
jgi:hypothetical protein